MGHYLTVALETFHKTGHYPCGIYIEKRISHSAHIQGHSRDLGMRGKEDNNHTRDPTQQYIKSQV